MLLPQVWSLSKGKLLRNIVFPSVIDALSLDPGEHVFYAGGRDGKIYIAGLNSPVTTNSNYGLHIIGALSEHRSVDFQVYSSFSYLKSMMPRIHKVYPFLHLNVFLAIVLILWMSD